MLECKRYAHEQPEQTQDEGIVRPNQRLTYDGIHRNSMHTTVITMNLQ